MSFEKFYSHITNEKLKYSIDSIKRAVSDIWTPDVKIIQDYTDHGIEHSERIFAKLYNIFTDNNDNVKKYLSEDEIYILVLGVILHDIGMQCDIKKHEKIKEIAEKKFSANFHIEFISGTANAYSKEEQNEIRRNHHLLTAAWLHYGFFYEDAFPNNALKTVEMKYRNDLVNICKFHSKLDINNCPEESGMSSIRCRFIAALLRLGDELDIDQYRVNLQTVKLFSYDLENSVFWYIHEHTTIQIIDHGIFVKIYLTESDYKVCGQALQDIVIDTFDNKNRRLTEILASNNLNIYISNNSKVEVNEYANSLSKEILDQIVSMAKKKAPAKVADGNNPVFYDVREKKIMMRLNGIRNTIKQLYIKYTVERDELSQTYDLINNIRHHQEKVDKCGKEAISIIKKVFCFLQGFDKDDLWFLYDIGVPLYTQVIDGLSQEYVVNLLDLLSNKEILYIRYESNLLDYYFEQVERILLAYRIITNFNFDLFNLSEGYIYKKTIGKLLAASVYGEAYKVVIWNLSNGTREPVAVLGGLYEKVYDLKILQAVDENFVIGKAHRRIYIWNLTISNQPICIFENNDIIFKYVVLRSINGGLYALGVTQNDICLWDFFKPGEPIKRIKIKYDLDDIFIVNTRLDSPVISYELMGDEALSCNINGKIWEIEEIEPLNFVFKPILDEKTLLGLQLSTSQTDYCIESYRIMPHKKILGVLTEEVIMLYDVEHKKTLFSMQQEGQQVMDFQIYEIDGRIYMLVYFIWRPMFDDGKGLVRCFTIENGEIIESKQWFRNENDIINGVITNHNDEIEIFFSEDRAGTIYTTAYHRKDFSEFYKFPETMYILDMTCG